MEVEDTVIGEEELKMIVFGAFNRHHNVVPTWESFKEGLRRGLSVAEKEIAQAQAEISFKLRTEDILTQLNNFNQRGLTITEAIDLLK